MIKKLVIIALLFSQVSYAQKSSNQLSWPEITTVNKPWTRWWWPGGIVDTADLRIAMEKYKKAGLGGMEITDIYGVKGQENKFIAYLSPEWMKMFTFTLREAKKLDLGIDLANASGWPFGGPWVDPEDACKNINYKIYSLNEGDSLTDKIEFIQQPLVRAVGQKPDIAILKDPISKNNNLQLYALDQIRFEKPLPLYILMAYSDSGQVFDLTPLVDKNGKLDWTAPDGKWTLYALFEGWHGKQVERAGPGGEGDVIDHFSGRAINNYLKHFDEAFKNYDISSLRGYFNDSYEVDDASGQADWTDNLFYEFMIRRGYDLAEYLPALFQKDTPEKNIRVLSDYRQTISDLLLEKFTEGWTEWAHRQGKFTRDQAHGSPGNILDLYAAADIPETEGNEIKRFKFAASAANVTGKLLTSCEAGTWLGEHFTSTLADVRKAADLFLLAGINHLFYHGTCFSPQNEPWPGFLFYAAVEFTPSNTFWNDFEQLNSYVAHVQSFMQRSRPDNDIIIYFPIFDHYSQYGKGMLEHFDGTERSFEGTMFNAGIETMLGKGYSFDYISDLQIINTESYDGLLETEGNTYKTLIIPECKYIPIETFSHILRLANDGARIIILGDLPGNIAGWADFEEKEKLFSRMKEGINFTVTNNPAVYRAVYGNGSFVTGNDLNELLTFSGIKRESMADNKIMFSRRVNNAGYDYFISNRGENQFSGWLPFGVKSLSAALFNPMSDRYGTADTRATGKGTTEIYLKLAPGESILVSTFDKQVSGPHYDFYDRASTPSEIKGIWKVDFIEGGPVLPASKETDRLVSWTEFGGQEVKDFSGTAEYSIIFNRPSGKADAWNLDLGRVCESARVILNGAEIATLIGPDYNVIINSKMIKPVNKLEIRVSNLMANRIAYMDRNNIDWKKFYNVNFAARLRENTKNGIFDASSWAPRESGLIGPVTLIPLNLVRVKE
jgi:hypothetical protein